MSLTKRMIDQLSDREYEALFGGPDDWPADSREARDGDGDEPPSGRPDR
jgi:hypothetical protein